MLGDDGVEEGGEFALLDILPLFGPENPAEPLGLLPPGFPVGRNLDDDLGIGEVDRIVADLREEKSIVQFVLGMRVVSENR